MNKDELIGFMLESINQDNRDLCRANSMPEEQTEEMIAQSQGSLGLIVSNLVDKMTERGLLA